MGLPFGGFARFMCPFPLHLSPRRQRVRAALGGGRKKRRFGMAECRVTIWPYFWLICPPCPLDHPNSTPKFRGWRKADASTFFLFQEEGASRDALDILQILLWWCRGRASCPPRFFGFNYDPGARKEARGATQRQKRQAGIARYQGGEKPREAHSTDDGQDLPRPRPPKPPRRRVPPNAAAD